MVEAELITCLARLVELTPAWDALAVACGAPQMSPAWVLGWWRNVAPEDALPRTVVVRDGDEVIGVAPFYVEPGGGRVDYRLPGIEIVARLTPLAVPGREWEVAEKVAEALADAEPRPDALRLEGIRLDDHWLPALRDGWPGTLRPPVCRTQVAGSPFASLQADSFDAWLGGKSSNFRGQMRRLRRRFADAGGVSRLATRETLAADAAAFQRLHAMRWDDKGHSNLVDLGDRFAAMVVDVGEQLVDDGRLMLRMLELDGEPISAQLFVAAGDTALFVNGGWDETHGALKPSLVSLLDQVEDGFARGHRCLDLGVGDQAYKLRFADGSTPLAWAIMMAPTARLPLTAARTAPAQLHTTVRRAISRERIDQLQAARARLHRTRPEEETGP